MLLNLESWKRSLLDLLRCSKETGRASWDREEHVNTEAEAGLLSLIQGAQPEASKVGGSKGPASQGALSEDTPTHTGILT